MKVPKIFNKMSRDEQESYLVKKLMKMNEEVDDIRRLLASVRGGKKIEFKLDVRPDEIALKDV